jgi:hypothetical protein
VFSEASLSLSGAPRIQITGLTVNTVVDIWNNATMVVAIYVLPCVTVFTKDGIAIVIFEWTDAFDGIRLLIFGPEGSHMMYI